MDKDNKYYDLIENLVKNNRRFHGYEAIIDDIIDDVYVHSEFVINSVSDENVINSYLEKVISTSIITVPKKLNFHRELRHRSINIANKIDFSPKKENNFVQEVKEDVQETKEVVQETEETENINNQELLIQEESNIAEQNIAEEQSDLTEQEIIVPQKVNQDLVDKMINTIEADSVIEVSNSKERTEDVVEEQIQEFEPNYDNIEELNTEENITDSFEQDDSLAVLEQQNTDNLDLNNDVDIIEDLTAVENSFEQDELIIDTEQQNTTEIDLQENINSTEEEQIVENSFEQDELILDSEQQNTTEIDLQEDLNTTEEEQFAENSFEQDEIILDAGQQDTMDMNFDDSAPVLQEIGNDSSDLDLGQDNTTLDAIDENIEDFNLSNENLDIDLQETQDDDFDLIKTDDIELIADNQILNEEEDVLDELQPVDASFVDVTEDNVVEGKQINYKKIDYSMFNYTPLEVEENIDKKSIISDLIQEDRKNPNLRIIDIFELRYKQNETIDNIVEKLNISKEDVLTALNKMADLV